MEPLRLAFDKALDQVFGDCSGEQFQRAFPQLARDHPSHLRTCRQQLVQQIASDAGLEYAGLLAGLKERIESLQTLLEVARKDSRVQALSKDPEAIVQAHRLRLKRQERTRLLSELETLQISNAQLLSETRVAEQQLVDTRGAIDQLVALVV